MECRNAGDFPRKKAFTRSLNPLCALLLKKPTITIQKSPFGIKMATVSTGNPSDISDLANAALSRTETSLVHGKW
jgi:hypothetical protein